jgi:hypothetical protein
MDPNGNFDFEARQEAILQRRLQLAAMLRNQRQFQENPGRMVGNHYVAPSWSQGLNQVVAPIMDQRQINQEQAGIQQDVGAFDAADRRAALAHIASSPTGHQLPPDMVGPTAPPTQQDTLAWAQRGAAIPSRKDVMSRFIADQEINEPIRQEDRQFKAQAREDRQAEARELRKQQEAEFERNRIDRGEQKAADRVARLEELEMRLADRGLDRAAREQASREHRQLVAQIAADKAQAKAEAPLKTTEAERVSAGYLNRMQEAEKTMSGIQGGDMNLAQKAVGGVPGIGKALQPYVLGPAKQKALQAQEDWVRAKLRKESGASIPPEEMAAEIRTYFPQPGEGPEVVAQKAASRKAAERQLQITAGGAASQAHPSGGATGSWDANIPPQSGASTPSPAKVRRYNPATGRLE